MTDHAFTMEKAALAAASQAAEATGELIRFAREGEYSTQSPFGTEVVGQLADALKIAMEMQPDGPPLMNEVERQIMADLKVALDRFLEGWVP